MRVILIAAYSLALIGASSLHAGAPPRESRSNVNDRDSIFHSLGASPSHPNLRFNRGLWHSGPESPEHSESLNGAEHGYPSNSMLSVNSGQRESELIGASSSHGGSQSNLDHLRSSRGVSFPSIKSSNLSTYGHEIEEDGGFGHFQRDDDIDSPSNPKNVVNDVKRKDFDKFVEKSRNEAVDAYRKKVEKMDTDSKDQFAKVSEEMKKELQAEKDPKIKDAGEKFVKDFVPFLNLVSGLSAKPEYNLRYRSNQLKSMKNADDVRRFVLDFMVYGAQMVEHAKTVAERLKKADKHVKAMAKIAKDNNFEKGQLKVETAKFVDFEEEFGSGRRKEILKVEEVYRRLREIYENVVDISADFLRTIRLEIKAQEKLKNEATTEDGKKIYDEQITQKNKDLKEIENLLTGPKGLSKQYEKDLKNFRKFIPESSLTQNVKAGLGKQTSKSHRTLIIVLSVAAGLIIGAAVYFFVMKKH